MRALVLGGALFVASAALAAGLAPPPPAKGPPTAAEAKKFVDQVDADLKTLMVKSGTAEWIKDTYITDDTERMAAAVNEELLGYTTAAVRASRRFAKVKADADTARKIHLLQVSSSLAAPTDAKKRLELATLGAKLEGLYGKAKACLKRHKVNGESCADIEALTPLLAKSRDYDELLDAWTGWHSISRPMRAMYERLVALANEGAREVGFADTGAVWRSAYDMPPEAFEKETERLWQQLRPLYEQLHCYVRGQLGKTYGGKVPNKGPMPAHVLGNMWAQDWS
ncbi:MAG TPA: M2 family metallopeptidase, partial [Polyangia bacterium]|nr:M2 family metallopeptidase [Polyangia bacterium]